MPNKRSDVLKLSEEDRAILEGGKTFRVALNEDGLSLAKLRNHAEYESALRGLQIELNRLQSHCHRTESRVAILFEGRDAAGKGGAIRRFTEHLSPRSVRVVALPKPTPDEAGQWYFQRYVERLPKPGEIVFFDRSWYNRGVVEPVNGFCSDEQYERFLRHVPEFERLIVESGLTLIKLWFEISKDEQADRFDARRADPLKRWKLSPVDTLAQERWDVYEQYKARMFAHTHHPHAEWTLIKTDSKKKARLESIRHVLSRFEYEGKGDGEVDLLPNPAIAIPYRGL